MIKSFVAALAASAILFVGAAHGADAVPQLTPIHWQYKLSDVAVTKTGADGSTTHALSLEVVDYFLQTIAGRVDQYPIVFASNAERIDVTDKLGRLTAILSELDEGASVNLDILRREAFAYNLAYDMDFPGSGEKANDLYQRLLKMTPDEPAANYLYGAFLAANDTLRPESVSYLEKAGKLGVKKANYTLGVVYVAMGKDQLALTCLQQYSTDYPDDQRVKSLIAAVKSGSIKHPQP